MWMMHASNRPILWVVVHVSIHIRTRRGLDNVGVDRRGHHVHARRAGLERAAGTPLRRSSCHRGPVLLVVASATAAVGDPAAARVGKARHDREGLPLLEQRRLALRRRGAPVQRGARPIGRHPEALGLAAHPRRGRGRCRRPRGLGRLHHALVRRRLRCCPAPELGRHGRPPARVAGEGHGFAWKWLESPGPLRRSTCLLGWMWCVGCVSCGQQRCRLARRACTCVFVGVRASAAHTQLRWREDDPIPTD